MKKSCPKYNFECCCPELSDAISPGSDGEGWGKAIFFKADKGILEVGCMTSPIKFCPWCGKELKIVKNK